MKYPVNTLIFGLEDIRISERKKIEEYLGKHTSTLIQAKSDSNEAVRTWIDLARQAVEMYDSGQLYSQEVLCQVTDKLEGLFDEGLRNVRYVKSYNTRIPGSKEESIQGCIKNVRDSESDLQGNSTPGDLELFLIGMRDQGEEFITDYGIQSAGFMTKLGGVYTRGLRVIAERENTTP